MKHLILIFALFAALGAAAQTAPKTLKGRVSDGATPLDYVSVSLAKADSTVVLSGNFAAGAFEFDNLTEKSYNVTFSSLGYETKTVAVQLTGSITDMGEIVLPTDAQQLAAVTVTAQRPLVQQKEGKLIVNVDGTMLANSGSLNELLKRSPGLIYNSVDNSISVFGKGAPVIYIDNVEVVSSAQLEALQSNEIDRIEIDRNPSAKYSAAGQAVLKIYTKHGRTDHADLLLYDNFTVSRKLGNTVGAQLDFKKGKWTNLLSYSFDNSNELDYEKSYETNTQPAYILQKHEDVTQQYSSETHSIFSGNEYSIDPNNKLGLQFSGVWSNSRFVQQTAQTVGRTGTDDQPRQIIKNQSTYSPLYNANFSYTHNPDSVNTFSVVLSYAHTTNPQQMGIAETDLNSGFLTNSHIDGTGNSDVYSAQADWGFRAGKVMNIMLGAKYSQVVSTGTSNQWNTDTGEELTFDSQRINDRIAAGYIDLNKHFGKLFIDAGLRYEHTSTRTTANESKIDTAYHGFFPSVAVSWQNDKWSVSLNYSRRISRPAFSQLNPNVFYVDSLEYSQGNPFLRPMYSNNIDLNVAFHGFNLMADYTQTSDYIANADINDPDNPDILKITSFNVPHTHSLTLGLTYAHTWKFYTASYEAYFTKPYNKIPYLNSTITLKRPQWYLAMKNYFAVTKTFSLNANLQWNSPYDNGINRQYSSLNITAGAQWSLCKGRLMLWCYANDIFHTAHYNWWESRIGNIVSGMRSNMDSRYVLIGVRWNFNNKVRSNVQQNRSNADELGRL